MTLTKQRTKSSPHQRKRSAGHHKQGEHYLKPYWPYLPIVAIVTFGLLLNSWLGSVKRDVLGYATDMTISGLLSSTNTQRSANGVGTLTLNSKLNSAAQAKANDMMVNDYWAHTSPSGLTPWYWITQAGYSYQSAGENLAYGFATSADTVTGWMNSPSHRANLLNGSFKEVGFGIVNAPNYQSSGPQTIVVAMYAEPYVAPAPAPAPTPAPTTSTRPKTTTTPTTTAQAPPAEPAPTTPTPVQGPTKADTEVATPENTANKSDTTKKTEPVPEKRVARVQVITAANVAWTQFAVSMVASVALLLFLLRHSLAWHKFLVQGERFIVHHPFLDIAFVLIATLGFILAQTTGVIR